MSKRSNIFDKIQKELDQKVFNGITPQPRISKFILDEMHKVLTPLIGFDPLPYMSIYLTGSLTTYQYDKTSDCDVSVFIDWDYWPTGEDPNLIRRKLIPIVMDKLDGTILPGTTHPIQHFIVPPGVEPQDLYKPGLRSAWSFLDHKWIVPPEKDRVHDISIELPVMYHRAQDMADKMDNLLKYDPIYAKEFWHQIHKKRQMDQQAGLGDFSEGNIVYKYLLHNGYFDRIREELGERISKTADLFDQIENLKNQPSTNPAFEYGRATAVMAFVPDKRAEAEQVYETWKMNSEFIRGWNGALDWAGHPQMPPESKEMYRQEFEQLRQSLGKVATGLPGEPYVPRVGEIWTLSNPFAGATPRTRHQPLKSSFEVIDIDDDEIWLRDIDTQEEQRMSMTDWYKLVWRGIAYRRKQDWQLQQSPEEAADLWPDTLPENWSKMTADFNIPDYARMVFLYKPNGQIEIGDPDIHGDHEDLTGELGQEYNKRFDMHFLDDETTADEKIDKYLRDPNTPQQGSVNISGDKFQIIHDDYEIPMTPEQEAEVTKAVKEYIARPKWSMVREAETQRLFLAYELPENIVAQVIQWQQENLPQGVHPEPDTNLHMTIAFLGDTDTSLIPGLQQILSEIDPSQVLLSGPIEYRELEKLAFLALQDNGGNEIVEQINEKLGALMGYEPQFRPWLPHITVWRFAPESKPNLQPQLPNFGSFTPLGVHVYTSVKNPAGGGIYQKVADDLSWVDKSTPYGTPPGGFIGGPEHPGDDSIDLPSEPRRDQEPINNDKVRDTPGSLKVIYDYDRDQIILGDIKKAQQFPPGQIIGDYREPDVYLNDHADAWFNPGYFKRLWTHSFPKRPIRHVILDKGNGQHEIVHHHQGSAILGSHEKDHEEQVEQEGDAENRQEAQAAHREAQEHVDYRWPDWDDVDFLSHEAVDNHQGYRDPAAIMGAVGNVQMANKYGAHADIFDIAADLLYKIQRQQAIVDGNKRTGAAVAFHFLEEHGIDTMPLEAHFEELAGLIENLDRGTTAEQLAQFFRTYLSDKPAYPEEWD